MGWLFSETTRAELIESITKLQDHDGGRWETIKQCTRGNILWTVTRWTDKPRTNQPVDIIGCHCLQKSVEKFDDGSKRIYWGYKSISECMGPYYYTCPLSYLDAAPVDNQDWRDLVKTYHKRINTQYSIGDRVMLLEGLTVPYLDITSSKPLQGKFNGKLYKVPKRLIILS